MFFMRLYVIKAFTLIELMIVVTIIGILATVAIPSFQDYILNAKMAESFVNIGAIQKAQLVAFNKHNMFFANSPPFAPQGGKKQVFEVQSNSSQAWSNLGGPLASETSTYFSYGMNAGYIDGSGTSYTATLGTPTLIEGTHDGQNLGFKVASGGGMCVFPFNYNSVGIGESNNEHWLVLYAGADFKPTSSNVTCTMVVSITRLGGGNAQHSPYIVLNKGE